MERVKRQIIGMIERCYNMRILMFIYAYMMESGKDK